MTQAVMDAENPLGDGEAHSAGKGEQSTEKRTRLSAPDERHAPSLSDMFNEIPFTVLTYHICDYQMILFFC